MGWCRPQSEPLALDEQRLFFPLTLEGRAMRTTGATDLLKVTVILALALVGCDDRGAVVVVPTTNPTPRWTVTSRPTTVNWRVLRPEERSNPSLHDLTGCVGESLNVIAAQYKIDEDQLQPSEPGGDAHKSCTLEVDSHDGTLRLTFHNDVLQSVTVAKATSSKVGTVSKPSSATTSASTRRAGEK
jgi:hypothetical protein